MAKEIDFDFDFDDLETEATVQMQGRSDITEGFSN